MRTPVPMGRLSETEPSPSLAVRLLAGTSPRTGVTPTALQSEPNAMFKELVHRSWRLAVTVGPLAAIALSLAAGLKWHW